MKKVSGIILSSIFLCLLLTSCTLDLKPNNIDIKEAKSSPQSIEDTENKGEDSVENKELQVKDSTKKDTTEKKSTETASIKPENKYAKGNKIEEQMSMDAACALTEITIQTAKEFIEAGNDNMAATWQQAYIDYLQKNSDTENLEGYVLIYVDNDEIPELVEIGKSEAKGCSIVNFSNNTINVTQLDRLNFSYIERENLLCNSDGLMDNYYDLVYSIIDGKMTLIGKGIYGAEDNTNVQIGKDGNFVYKYKWNDVEMSKEEYEKELESVYDSTKSRSGYNWGEWYSSDEMAKMLEHFNE